MIRVSINKLDTNYQRAFAYDSVETVESLELYDIANKLSFPDALSLSRHGLSLYHI